MNIVECIIFFYYMFVYLVENVIIKKNFVKYIFGILESKWFEIRIDNNYLVFFFCRRKNVSLLLKRKLL